MSTRKSNREKTIAAIVDAAEEILRTGGVDALTAGAVADRVGLARNSLYRYVDAVEDLRGMVIIRHLPKLFDLINTEMDKADGPEEALDAYVEANLRGAANSSHGWLMSIVAEADFDTAKAISEMHSTMATRFHTVVEQLCPDDAPFTAELINSLVNVGFQAIERGDDVEHVVARCVEAAHCVATGRPRVAKP